jgi:hypothetical protein
MITFAFEIKGYPGTGRRVEADSDLAAVSGPDLVQGAFMGDAAVNLDGTDFSTSFGWVTLLYWCQCLSVTIRDLENATDSSFQFSESSDFMSFHRDAEILYVSCTYRPGVAAVSFAEFSDSVRSFIRSSLEFLAKNHPRAFANPAMADVLYRLDAAAPNLGSSDSPDED